MAPRKNLLDLTGEFQNKKRLNPFFIFIFFALIGGAVTYIILGWLQLLLLLLWGVSQTKLQIFVVVAFLMVINSFKVTFTWNLK